MVECRTPEREVGGSKPTAAVLCPWARHFTPRKYWLITQEAMAPSRYDWKIVDWDVKPQHKQTNNYPPRISLLSEENVRENIQKLPSSGNRCKAWWTSLSPYTLHRWTENKVIADWSQVLFQPYQNFSAVHFLSYSATDWSFAKLLMIYQYSFQIHWWLTKVDSQLKKEVLEEVPNF